MPGKASRAPRGLAGGTPRGIPCLSGKGLVHLSLSLIPWRVSGFVGLAGFALVWLRLIFEAKS